MKINTILSIFAPKDVKFFPLLEETAEILEKSAIYLQKLFSSDLQKEEIKELCRLIKTEETKGDKVTGQIFKRLNDTFITPFDREDIDALADSMDDAIDAINRSAQKVLLYSPESLPPSTSLLADTIKSSSIEVKEAVYELSNLKKTDQRIREHAREIKKMEEKADALYEEAIMNLFKTETRPVELIKLKEIIQELEKSANKINNVGKVLKTIIIKFA